MTKKIILLICYLSILVLGFVLGLLLYPENEQEPEVKGSNTQKIYRALAIPNDTNYNLQWNMPKMSAPAGWDITTGSESTIIAVLDTGILTTHEDLVNKFVPGYDFVSTDSDPNPDPGGGTAYYHGTMVASLVAAQTNNSMGIAGTCWECKIMPVRVLNNNGQGTTDVIADGIRYAADNGARVINMSFGYPHDVGLDDTLTSAINYAYGKGVVLVAAAGNDGSGVNYPGANANVIAVGATNQSDIKTSWSSYGAELDMVAPGENVVSANTVWNGATYTSNAYTYASGTSISSPQVAGLSALMISKYPTLTPAETEKRLKIWASKVSAMDGNNFTIQYGYGRTDFASSLAGILSITSPVSGVTLASTSPIITGTTDATTSVNIYSDSVLRGTVTSDTNGNWSYTINNLSLGAHYIEAESTIFEVTRRVGISITIDDRSPVYRFWNNNGTHFYTASESEKNNVLAQWPGTFTLEGVAYRVGYGNGRNPTALFRFWNNNGTHFYTASESEKNNIIARWPNIFKFEGVAYSVSTNPAGSLPIYRFWNNNGTHFYTASESEKNNIIARWPGTFKFEGIAYYIDN